MCEVEMESHIDEIVTKIMLHLLRMLGYSYGQATIQSRFGSVPSTFYMDDVQCSGSETSILDCTYSSVDNCGSDEGAGVICTNNGWSILPRHN